MCILCRQDSTLTLKLAHTSTWTHIDCSRLSNFQLCMIVANRMSVSCWCPHPWNIMTSHQIWEYKLLLEKLPWSLNPWSVLKGHLVLLDIVSKMKPKSSWILREFSILVGNKEYDSRSLLRMVSIEDSQPESWSILGLKNYFYGHWQGSTSLNKC